MNESKYSKLLKYAGILNIIIGACATQTRIYSALMIFFGIMLIVLSKKDEDSIIEYRSKLVFFIVALFPFNFISAILVIIAYDDIKVLECNKINGINAPPGKKKIIIKKKPLDPEVKKIDILLKLGVGMVFASGLLFATTSWSFINDITKAAALILLGILFQVLSIFTEKKLKLYKTTFMYFILSISFFFLTVVGMLYFGIAGSYLTYSGEGCLLALSITLLTMAGLSYATYLKFSSQTCIYITYSALLFSITNFLTHLGLDYMVIIFLVSALLLIINIMAKKDSTLFIFSKIVSYTTLIFIVRTLSESNGFLTLLTCLTNVVNLSYLTYLNEKNNNEDESLVNLIVTYGLLYAGAYKLDFSLSVNSLLLFSISTLYTVILKLKVITISKKYNALNYILYVITAIITMSAAQYINQWISILIAAVFMVINFILSIDYKDDDDFKLAMFMEPISILSFMLCLCSLDIFYIENIPMIAFEFASIIYCIVHFSASEELRKKIYIVSTAIGLTLYYITETSSNLLFIVPLLILIPNIYYFYIASKMPTKNKASKIISYLLLLYGVGLMLIGDNLFNLNTIIASIIYMWVIAVIGYLTKEEVIKKISYIAMAIPLYIIIDELSFDSELKDIMISTLILYITFVIIKIICKQDKTKNILGTIGVITATVFVFFNNNITTGLFVGLVGISVTMIGFYRKELKAFFATGITITILNVLYQLKDLWELIPFWLYLLVVGLGLIFFVTYIEVKKMNKK